MSEVEEDAAAMKSPSAPATETPRSRRGARRQRGNQLDFPLPLPTVPPVRKVTAVRPCSRERAQWWFDQMRLAVDEGRTVEVAGVF